MSALSNKLSTTRICVGDSAKKKTFCSLLANCKASSIFKTNYTETSTKFAGLLLPMVLAPSLHGAFFKNRSAHCPQAKETLKNLAIGCLPVDQRNSEKLVKACVWRFLYESSANLSVEQESWSKHGQSRFRAPSLRTVRYFACKTHEILINGCVWDRKSEEFEQSLASWRFAQETSATFPVIQGITYKKSQESLVNAYVLAKGSQKNLLRFRFTTPSP